jgi:hypothetical protein
MQQQRAEAAQLEQTKIVRSAKDAAWEATDAAVRSAKAAENSITLARSAKTRATIGLLFAAVAAIAAVAPLVAPIIQDERIEWSWSEHQHHIQSQLRAWVALLIANSSREHADSSAKQPPQKMMVWTPCPSLPGFLMNLKIALFRQHTDQAKPQ